MKNRNIIYLLILFFVFFIWGCTTDELQKVTVREIKYETSNVYNFEVGESIEFGMLEVRVIYSDNSEEIVTLNLSAHIDVYDIIAASDQIGEKEFNFNFYDNHFNVCEGSIKVIVTEKSYKNNLKAEINNYKNDLEYSENNLKAIKGIKMSAIASINSAINEDEAIEFAAYAKELIDEIKTLAEEEMEMSIDEVLTMINELEEEMKTFINYDDTIIKEELNKIKDELNTLPYEEEIENTRNIISALSSNFYGVRAKVLSNQEKINALTEILNSFVLGTATKEELSILNDKLKEEYTKAIDDMSTELIEKIADIDIVVEDGVLKWKTNKFDEYKELSKLGGATVVSAGLNEEGHLIINLSDDTNIDAGLVYDASANEKINSLLNTIAEIETQLNELEETVSMLEFVVSDVTVTVGKMNDYFTDMGFNFDNGSSLDLMTAIITLLPIQLEKMGYDFKIEDITDYQARVEKAEAELAILMGMVNELKATTNNIYDIIQGEGSLLEKELLMQEEMENVGSFLTAMGIEEEKALAIESFLDDLRQENQNNLISKINIYFDTFYNEDNYILDANDLGSYYTECVEYSESTIYDSVEVLAKLKKELTGLLNEEKFIIDSLVYTNIIQIEQEYKKLDTNLEIVKAFLVTKLECNTSLTLEDISAYKNRILTTKSIDKAIELYELAIN